MKIEPYAWLVTAPLTMMLVGLYFQPANCWARRMWRDAIRWEMQAWDRFMQSDWHRGPGAIHHRRWLVYGMIVAAFAIASVASFGAYVGLIAN